MVPPVKPVPAVMDVTEPPLLATLCQTVPLDLRMLPDVPGATAMTGVPATDIEVAVAAASVVAPVTPSVPPTVSLPVMVAAPIVAVGTLMLGSEVVPETLRFPPTVRLAVTVSAGVVIPALPSIVTVMLGSSRGDGKLAFSDKLFTTASIFSSYRHFHASLSRRNTPD